jgi:hypothetical protein
MIVSFDPRAVVMMMMTEGSMSLNFGIASIPLIPGI